MLVLPINTMSTHVIKNGGGRRAYIQWAGLEKLGFPWILSSGMSLFNGLQGNFSETFYFARLMGRERRWGASEARSPARGHKTTQ